MTVFIAHAPADRAAAEALEKVLERRGQFVELDDGTVALRPVQTGDALVLLVSQALANATARLRLEQRSLDAWADGRLVLVKLDAALAPVGLRDLPAIDAGDEAQRDAGWSDAADAVRAALVPSAPARSADMAAPAPPRAPAPSARAPARNWRALILAPLLALPGVAAIAVLASIWLVNRIGPAPGGWPELRRGVGAFGARFGLSPGATEIAFAAAIALTLAVVAVWLARLFARPKAAEPAARAPAPAPVRQTDALFVSYARANESVVLPVIEAAGQAGRRFWLDRHGVVAGDGWAGEIVRAIRGAAGVLVMCSKAAFESDHVKREIYLADRYKKKLVPVFIEPAEAPEDFEYFFAGVQPLNLFEKPEAERSQALMNALGSS